MDVLKRSQAYFVYIEDFDENDIESIIDEYVTRYGVQYVNFDYIQMTPKLSSSSKNNYGRQLREDEILSSLSRKLKQLATKYEIFIMSSTQLNDNGNNEDNNYNLSRTERAIRGSKAVVDKIDYGVIGSKLEERDLNKVNQLLNDKYKFKATQMTPNYAHFIYKNRAGLNGVILWTQFDQGNLRENIVLVTDYDLNELDITPLEAVATQEETEIESSYEF
jgi:replicative DNA helicase